MIKRFLVNATLCVFAVFCSNSAKAGVLFDANGGAPGGASIIDTIDWAPGNGLSLGGSKAIVDFVTSGGTVQNDFTLFFQAKMAATFFDGVDTGQSVGNFTVVGGITEIVTAATGIGGGSFAIFDLAPTQRVNYFEIFYDPTPTASDLTGASFNSYGGGPLAPAGGIGTNVGLGPNLDSIRVLAGTVTDAVVSTFAAFPSSGPLDIFGGNNYPGLTTLIGSGSTTLDILVNPTFLNPLFFSSNISSFSFTTQAGVPFATVNPSARFLTTSTTTAVGIRPSTAGAGIGVASLGVVNGAGVGPDFQLFVDGSSSLTSVPEPTSVMVFGLLGLGAFVVRRRK